MGRDLAFGHGGLGKAEGNSGSGQNGHKAKINRADPTPTNIRFIERDIIGQDLVNNWTMVCLEGFCNRGSEVISSNSAEEPEDVQN